MPNHPIAVQLTANQTYLWCSCGKSQSQPLCDGSHQGSGKFPVKITSQEDKTVYLCGCKHTGHPPLCDGSHQLIEGGGRDEYYDALS